MAIDRRRMSGGYMPLRQAIDQLFEGSFITPQVFGMQGSSFPPADMCMTDDDVIIKMAIPGAKPSDINVSVTGDTVTVSGSVKNEWHSSSPSGSQGQSGNSQTSQGQTTPPSSQKQASGQSQSQKSQQGKQSSEVQPYFEEIWQGSFQRTFTLPVQVDANKANASFENGILTLTLPKSEATKPRKIQVQQRHTIEGQSSQSQSGQQAQSQTGSTQTEKVPVQSGSSS